jgi:signal transduction histidine kinase
LPAERADDIKTPGVAVTAAASCASVTADRDGLAMALRNLPENALKFTRNVPQPTIKTNGSDTDTGATCILSPRRSRGFGR